MIFHLGFELPEPVSKKLDHTSDGLTEEEIRILKVQIRKNSNLINTFVTRLDLLINKERYPQEANFIPKIRAKLEVLMDENDTFRKVLWKHFQGQELLNHKTNHDLF